MRKFKHYKGNTYNYLGLVTNGLVTNPQDFGIYALHHETLEKSIIHHGGDGQYYCPTLNGDWVLYERDGKYWIREYFDFHGYVYLGGDNIVKRFVEIEEDVE